MTRRTNPRITTRLHPHPSSSRDGSCATELPPKLGRNFFERYDHMIQPEPNTGCWLWLGAATPGRVSVGVGYGMINLGRKNGRTNLEYTHRAAYETVHGKGSAFGLIVRHACDMPLCVNPDHLSLGTHKDNAQDMVRRGRSLRGMRATRARLTDSQVAQIISQSRAGIHQRVIAKSFGVDQSAVSLIASGKRWSHVTGRAAVPRQSRKAGEKS